MMLTYDPTQKIEPRFPTKEMVLLGQPPLIYKETCSGSILTIFTFRVWFQCKGGIMSKLKCYKF